MLAHTVDFPALRARAHMSACCGLVLWWRMFVQRTLAEHGDVPVRRSVQDCATRGNLHAVLRAAPPHAVPYMLRRCVGFSWAKPSVTKSATHLPVFLVFKSPRPAPQAPRPARKDH